jgi:N-acetylmuramoyl-L-alanine amidase
LEGGQSVTKIYLDAGHGGKDSGAVGNGLYEKNVVLDLQKRIIDKLNQYKDVQINTSRTTDVFLELSARANKANKWGADCFISLHLNSASASSAKGFETFIYNGSVGNSTVAFQNVMHQEIWRQIGPNTTDRGKKRANFAVIRETNMKAILVENLFVSNSAEAGLLKTSSFLDRLAQGYVNGLEKFFGLVKETRPPVNNAPVTKPDTGETLFQVVAGTYANRDNAEAQVARLKKDGYSSYIQEKE